MKEHGQVEYYVDSTKSPRIAPSLPHLLHERWKGFLVLTEFDNMNEASWQDLSKAFPKPENSGKPQEISGYKLVPEAEFSSLKL